MTKHVVPSFMMVLLFAGSMSAAADDVMGYVYHPPESPLDKRYEYQWEILRTALERTKDKYGAYVLEPSELMTEKRQAYEMKNATGKLTVMYLSTTPDFERDLFPVRIPVDKNLGGYCVFLIRKQDQPRFSQINSINDLAQFSYGLGLDWIDVDILRENKLKVITGSSYDGLFEMLANRRFDIFLRAAVEVLGEYDARKEKMPDLCIEQNIVLYYRLPMYFWFPKNAAGKRLADRARDGMMGMIEDGTYDPIFEKYQKEKIQRLNLKNRRIFEIKNPNVGPETPINDKRLWFDPKLTG